jgi:competence protein ComEC
MPVAACAALVFSTLLLSCPVSLPASGVALVLLCGALLVRWRRGQRAALLVLLAALPVLAAVDAAGTQLRERWPDRADSTDLDVTGSVCEFPRDQPGSWRFVLTTDGAARARGVPSRVLVSWYTGGGRPAHPPVPGEQWQLRLRLRPPRGLSNPGGFDYEKWLFAQRIGATGWVRDAPRNRRVAGTSPACAAASWRAGLAGRLATALDGRESAPYVLGLAIGAYQALPESEWDKLRRTGTIHLISISGFHIALVAGPGALLGFGLARGWLATGRRCRPRVVAAWTAFLVASLYGVLAGFSVPTARSVVAVGLVALLVTSRRAVRPVELLSAVVLGVLLIEPLAPLVPGFWLSFAGVAVLAAVALRVQGAGPGPVGSLLAVQAGMTVGLAPLLVLFFGQVPVSGALANLVAVPAFSFVLLPLTLLGTAVSVLAPAAGVLVLRAAAAGFDAWRWFLGWCADLPHAVWYLPEPSPAALALAGLGVVLLLWPPPMPGRWLGLPLLTGLLATGAAPVPAGGLRLTVLDVGQGLAVLAQTAGHALLYDTGPAFRNSDAGQRVVVPALQALQVPALDALVISHADADHSGGAGSVLERYRPARLLGAAAAGRPAAACEAGDRWQWDGVDFEVLHPRAGVTHGTDNESSCVLRVSAAGVSLLLTGDIPAAVERALAAEPDFAAADLVVAAHHGSRTSSSPEFVAATRARYVIFTTGFHNRWHFPAREVVARWRAVGACLLDTAGEGALQFDVRPGAGLQLTRRTRATAPGVWLARPAAASACN